MLTTAELAKYRAKYFNGPAYVLLAHITEQEQQLRQVQAEAVVLREALLDVDAAHQSATRHANKRGDNLRIMDLWRRVLDALSSTPATSAYDAKVQRMEMVLCELQQDLKYWQTTPCINVQLDGSPADPPCWCVSCWAKKALPLVRAALAEGEG